MNTTNCGKPSIVVRQTDHARLTSLALAAPGRDLDVAEELLIELERADVLEDDQFPRDAVGVGSTVSYSRKAAPEDRSLFVIPVSPTSNAQWSAC